MGTPTRMAQDDNTFATMSWNSVSDSAIAVMALKTANCTINGAVSGLLLFKCLLINNEVEAVHDAGPTRRKLTGALHLMRECAHSVTQFNIICRGLIDQLAQCGQTFSDGKTCVEEAHLDHPDEPFARHIQAQQDHDRESPPGNTMEELMSKGQAKSDQLEFMAQHKSLETIKQEEAVALKAEVANLEKTVNEFKKDNEKGGENKSTDKPSSESSNKGSNDFTKKQ
jgi:hypothetical protein